MNFDPNPLFYKMVEIYHRNKTEENKIIFGNGGGSRSSKTFDTFHFIYAFCDNNPNRGLEIYILRDTLENAREKTFKDFKKCMEIIGADVSYKSEGMKPTATIKGNNIFFRGLDKATKEGYPSDIVFVNEALDTEKTQLDGIIMRCRLLMIFDWNPKYTQHWVYDLEKRQNAYFTHTTFRNNKHLQKSVINEILGYEPYLPNSYEINGNELFYKGKQITETNQPLPHPTNIKQGTADEFKWKVYGLGLRGAMKGVIFNQLEWIETFPEIAFIYGNDFGFTSDPNALVKYAEDENNIWFEVLGYVPIETPEDLSEYFKSVGVLRHLPITCDSSDKYTGENKGTVEMVKGLQNLGWQASKVSKTKSIMYWILSMKRKKIHCVKDKNGFWEKAKIERENYIFKEINGIQINQPIDKFNHIFDAVRYCHISHNSKKRTIKTAPRIR